jgi:hypothetical protein
MRFEDSRRVWLATLLLATPAWSDQVEVDEDVRPALVEGVVSFGAGTAWVEGSKGAYAQRFQTDPDFFGGLEELTYRRESDLDSILVRAALLPGQDKYSARMIWTRAEVFSVDLGYDQFRTFFHHAPLSFRPNSASFSPGEDRLHVDRSRLWLELGFTLEDLPRLRVRYERLTRRGAKPSTHLGETNLTGGAGARSIVPATLDLDETRDVFTVDAEKSTPQQRWATGLRYDRTRYSNARYTERRPGEANAQRKVTTTENLSSDMFSTHGYYLRAFGEKTVGSVGALFSTLDTNIGGNRVYGTDFDAVFDPVFPRRQIGDLGFLDLGGGNQLKQYVFNGNLMYRPHKHWAIRPAVRYEHLRTEGVSTFIATNVLNSLVTARQDSSAASEKQENRLTETLEIRYTGRPMWTYTVRGEWMQSSGDLEEVMRNAATGAALLDRATDYSRKSQKYIATAQWHARPSLSITSEYYFKVRQNDYRAERDSTPPVGIDRYPAFITNQDFETHDVNVRLSWRAATWLSTVTRYDYQRSIVTSSFAGFPELRGARTATHILSQSITTTPRPYWFLSGTVNLTFDQTTTPVADLIRHADNNYVNVSVISGWVVGKRSDLYLELSRVEARDFIDKSSVSLPYGADLRYDSAALTWVFKASEALTYTIKYGYAEGRDALRGDRSDYRAHTVYSKVQYAF